MPRLHTLWLIAFCVPLLVLYMATETTTTQAVFHSLSLNGTSSYVSVPNGASLSISGPMTVEGWIKVNSITGNYQDIVCKESWGQAGTGGGYEFAITSTGKVRLDLYQGPTQYTTVIGSTSVTAGTWQHVAGVFDGNQIRVYLNGTLDGSLSTTNGPASGTSVLHIGKSTYTGYYFGGLIDEVRISAAALYSANFTPGLGPANNTRGLWKFDGQTANDSSGQANHGILQSGATYSSNVPSTPNNAPAVTLTHPVHNTSFAAGSTILMDATASDSDGTIDRVDFYQGPTLLGSDTSSPYTFAWNNVLEGVYSITAKATDDDGAITTSNAVSVNVAGSSVFHSLSLNGTSSYVSVPNSASLSISGPMTVEAWIKVNAITGNYQDIVCKESWGQAGTGGGYEFAITSTGKVRLDLYQGPTQYTTVIGSTSVTAGTWQHIAGVFDGNQIRVYLNGTLDGSLSTTNGPASGTSVLHIGKSTYTGYYFGGLIDEVRISAAALYSANFTPGLGPANNTRGHWKFDGQTANDSSGQANHGTLQGGATYSTSVAAQSGPQRPVPVAGGPYNGQPGQAVQFSNSGSFDPDGTIASYHWNFGDGTSANSSNPSHTYTAAGFYTATLTVTDNTGLIASAVASVTVSSGGNARLDPLNQIGGDTDNPLSQNFNWNLPLVTLPGRGLDLSLTLSYNSLVWTKLASNAISFDDDKGFPSPGFRLGFPVIQPLYYNAEAARYAFLLIGSDGSRTELRQVGTSALYVAADSSHTLLDATAMTLRTADGSQLSYALIGSEFQCTQIKDRNGNYITIDHTTFGRIDKVIDTLGREIKFNYDGSGLLLSITQIWNQGLANQLTHEWATFTYVDTTIQTSFTGLTMYGASNGGSKKTLSKVTLADGSHSDFSYTSWGQVWKISDFAGTALLNTRSYNLPGSPLLATSPQLDCPRFTERRDWARYWNGDTEGSPAPNEEALTTFTGPVSDSWTMPDGSAQSGTRAQLTSPDGTLHKIYFLGVAGTASGWRRGLPALVDTYSGGPLPVRRIQTTWTQDNTSVSYPLNPRVSEKNVHDSANNRARTEITYQQVTFANGTSCHLPRDVYEYASNATTRLRSTRTLYNTNASYTDRRILGLVSEKQLYEGDVNNGGTLMSKVAFFYDNENGASSIQGTDAPIQHDNTNYSASFVTGRGNLSSVKRFDVFNTAQSTTTRIKYNTAGSVVSSKDALDHEITVSYSDSFSDNNNTRNTLAYPTTVIDPESFSITTKYSFDIGVVISRRTPKPNETTNQPGPEQFFTFDSIGRLQQISNSVNSAYTRFEYSNSQSRVDFYTTVQEGSGESHSFEITDGVGRVVGTAKDHPGSVGGFSGQKIVYDIMGRVFRTYNPTETTASGPPSQWNAVGDDLTEGWLYTQQTYDWRNRPLRTTHPDTKYREADYSGCGCAGGEVVTLTDEGTTVDIDPGPAVNNVTKKRQRKIYTDVLGRTVKIEILNWHGGTEYSTTVIDYNARDQAKNVKRYQGPDTSGIFREASMTYDGFGRLKTRKVPEQKADPNVSGSTDHTTWEYNADDTVQSMTDARGIATTFGYNARHLLTSITYPPAQNLPPGIPATANVTYTFDAAGNRISMSAGAGNTVNYTYDSLSRLLSEAKQFPGLSSTYTLAYEYNLANQVKTVTDQSASTSFTYAVDNAGRLSTITSTGLGASAPLASNAQYRATGALKQSAYGNGTAMNLAYNKRGLIAQYSLSGVKELNGAARAEGSDFQYHADGQIKFASDFYGRSFSATSAHDKSYQHDQAGRLQVALSGIEANDFLNNTYSGPLHGPAPYLQSYTHDVWNNLIGRTGSYWTETDELGQQPYDAHNRNTAWSYDPDGRLLSMNEPAPDELPFVPAQHTYNAAGLHVKQTQTTSRVMPLPGNPVWTTVVTVDASYDGDGQQYKRVNTKQTNSQQPNVETKFLLRSSVLGGQVITEYNGTGARQKSFVYGGGALITSSPTQGLIWRFNNPVTGDGRETDALGKVATESYLDPEGIDGRASDPASTQGEPPPLDILPQAGAYSAYLPRSLGGSGRCSFNGIETGCALVGSLLSSGAADQCLGNDCGAQNVTIIARNRAGRVVGRTTVTVFEGDPGWNGSLDGFYDVGNGAPPSFDPSRAFAFAFLSAAGRTSGEGAFTRSEARSEISDSHVPCPPTQQQISQSSALKKGVKEAQERAAQARDTGRTPGFIEHGGWILWKTGTRNTFSYMIKEPQTRLNSPPGYQFTDTAIQVWLHAPPAPMKGWEIVAIFHIHPDNAGAHEGDTESADAVKVPGFVGQPDGKIFKVGNFNRGIINRDLPKDCR